MFQILRSFSTTPTLSLWRGLAWIAGLLLLIPVIHLLLGLFAPVEQENWNHVREYLLAPALRSSLILIVSVGFLSLLFAVPAAWCVANFRFPGRAILSVLLVLPLAVPPYVAAYISTEAREAFAPVLVSTREKYGIDAFLALEQFHRFAWLSLMLAAVLYPYVFLAARAAFAGRASRYGEAGRLLGSGPWRGFFTISLPLARPALVAGLFLVAMEVLNDYGAVLHFGIDNMTTALFRTWFGLNDLASARRLAAWILLGVFALLALERSQRGRAKFDTGGSSPAPLRKCKPSHALACWAACLPPVLVGIVYPVVTLIGWLRVSGGIPDAEGLARAAGHSLALGAAVSIGCLVLALLVIGLIRFCRSPSQKALGTATSVAGYACPGAVLAVGVLGLSAALRENIFVIAPMLLLAFALGCRFFAVSGQMVGHGLELVPRSLDRAARTLGRGPAGTFLSIHLPLLRPVLAGAAALVFVDVVKELPLSLLLRPFDFETLGTWTYGLANQGKIFSCAAPALTIILLCGLVLTMVEAFGWNRR